MNCTITSSGLVGRLEFEITNRLDSNDCFLECLANEKEEKKRRLKMKGDPNELRKKANSKSTRPKWMDRR